MLLLCILIYFLYESKTAVHTGIIVSISTNEYAGRHASKRGNSILIS